MRDHQQKLHCRRQPSRLVVSLLILGGVSSLVGLGACAQQQSAVVIQPTLVSHGARLTKETSFLINTKVFLIKKPERVPALTPYSKAGETQTHVLSANDGKTLMAGLEKSRHVMVNANGGSAMTVAGQPAIREAIRELIYPVEYDPPQLSKDHSVTPAHPTIFETKNCGFQSSVTPIVNNSGDLEVSLRAESTTFDGFVNYGSPISTAGKDWLGNPVSIVLTENRVQMPVFTTGKVESRVRATPTDYVIITGLPQGRPLNAKLHMPEFVSKDPISNTEVRKPYQLVVMHEILALAD